MKKWMSTVAFATCAVAFFVLVVKYGAFHLFINSAASRGLVKLKIPVDRQSLNKPEVFSKNSLSDNAELIRHVFLGSYGANASAEKDLTKNHSTNLFQNKVDNNTKFAVVSASTPFDDNYNYVFYAPLTALAWKRIGFKTIVIVSGSELDWQSHHVLKLVHQYLVDLNSIVIFLDSDPDNRIMISQVSRLFACSLLEDKLKNDDFLIISDADLWPLDENMYQLKNGYKVISLNSDCCGNFDYNGTVYKMLPMANVGASVGTWLDLIGTNRFLPKSAEDILTYFEHGFGAVARQRVNKGENFGWYQDQNMLSILLHEWIERWNSSLIQYVPRNVGEDRIDRAWWSTKTIENKTDAHLLQNAYSYKTWFQLTPILRLMYGEESSPFNLCMQYFEDFLTALREHSRQNG